MFLSRKALEKIRFLAGAYFLLGVLCLVAFAVFQSLQAGGMVLLLLGVICFVCGFLSYMAGRYTEGKGNLINSGNKLVFHELRPGEFIRIYEEKRDYPDNVISTPDYDVLQLLVTAYDALGDPDSALEVLEQMGAIAPEKKKIHVKLLKTGLLFSIGRVDEAGLLYAEVVSSDMDMITKALLDVVMRSDRAMALGDYATSEGYYLQALRAPFPRNTPLSILYAHFALAKIYVATGRAEEAKIHLNYCIQNGGDTNIKPDSKEILCKL